MAKIRQTPYRLPDEYKTRKSYSRYSGTAAVRTCRGYLVSSNVHVAARSCPFDGLPITDLLLAYCVKRLLSESLL